MEGFLLNSEFTIAVHSLVLLSHLPGQMATSGEIAANVCTHAARIRKIMGMLRKAGYVKTKEGFGGGFLLNCDPDAVTLADIYRVTSAGSLKPYWCTGDKSQSCPFSSNMQDVMNRLFCDAEKHMEQYLAGRTLGDVLHEVRFEETDGR